MRPPRARLHDPEFDDCSGRRRHRAFSSFNQISVSRRRNWTSLISTTVPRALSLRALAISSSIFSRSISFSSAATISAFPAPALRSISSLRRPHMEKDGSAILKLPFWAI